MTAPDFAALHPGYGHGRLRGAGGAGYGVLTSRTETTRAVPSGAIVITTLKS